MSATQKGGNRALPARALRERWAGSVTVKEIEARLTAQGIGFEARMSKADLVQLYAEKGQ